LRGWSNPRRSDGEMCVQNLGWDGFPVRAQARTNDAESTTSEFGGFVLLPDNARLTGEIDHGSNFGATRLTGWSLSPV
jgi:hypothetical protein